MGHHLGAKSSIVPLIDRLNRYPVGLVDSTRLREILALLFDETEAFVASRFPLTEATLAELCRATRMPAAELAPVLERMADKGLIMDLPYGDEVYYLLLPGLIGFFEFTFMKRRTDLPLAEVAQLMNDYLTADPHQGQAREFFGSRTPLTRSLVYEEAIPVSSTVTSYEAAREIVRAAGFGAVGLCYCRHKQEHLGRSCARQAPVEGMCISLGTAARFMVRRGFAEERSSDQLLAVLDRARALNLTHITDNVRHKPAFICNCCACCCELLAGVRQGYPDGIARTPFVAEIDSARCNGCGACAAACNIAAIEVAGPPGAGRSAQVRTAVCLGCGACIGACSRRALALVERRRRPLPPAREQDLFYRLLKEKKRLRPFLAEGVKRRLRRWLAG